MNVLKAVLTVSLLGVAACAAAVTYGGKNWGDGTRRLRARLEKARAPMMPHAVDFCELEGLPEPVQRYFRTTLEEGRPMVTGVRMKPQGLLNMGEKTDRWRPFVSDQRVTTRPPGFDWDARARMMPGLTVHVHDAYVSGEGILSAALLGLMRLVDHRGAGDVAAGELMGFLAEAVWYPTVLLPSQGVRWEAMDARTARATLADEATVVTLVLLFMTSAASKP